MSKFNRREFLEATAASYLLGSAKAGGAPGAPGRISESEKTLRAQGNEYTWEYSKATEHFRLLDQWGVAIAEGTVQPAVIVQSPKQPGSPRWQAGRAVRWEVQENRIHIHYEGVNGSARLAMTWSFDPDGFWLEPLAYETSADEAVVSLLYFAEGKGRKPLPALTGDYFVVPGVATASEMSPIIPTGFAGAFLKQKCWLGRGWAVDPEVLQTQQWALPLHYFCAYHRSPFSYQKEPSVKLPTPPPDKFLETYLNALCCGLADLPNADFMMQTSHNNCASPLLNYRGDLWGHLRGPGSLKLGARLYWTVGPNYYEAIRRYYLGLARAGVIRKKINSPHKNAVALAPSFCTFGEQLALNRIDDFDERTFHRIYDGLKRSGTQAKLLVIDDQWQGKTGSLRHSEERFPHFPEILEGLRADGMYVGLWAAFLRCPEPAALGLTLANMLHTRDGKPYRLGHEPHGFYILDCTQPEVQAVMRRQAREFMQRYRPDFLKFDFGYEIPSLNVVAPQDMAWAGERFMMKALQVSIGAMREMNPDLVVLYYSLSPLFLDYFDLHSPDDLGRCTGDFDLEANRRFFFSSLLGELGMPTWGSSGYSWPSAPSIWFDSAAVGTLGSLLSYWGPEARALAKPDLTAKFNGLTHVIRPANTFSMRLLDEAYHGPARGAHAASWARTEQGEVVLVALRDRRFDGRKAAMKLDGLISTSAPVVVASKTAQGLARASKLAVVPYGDGEVRVRREASASATLTEHYFGGGRSTRRVGIEKGWLKVALRERAEDGSVVEWIEVDLSAA